MAIGNPFDEGCFVNSRKDMNEPITYTAILLIHCPDRPGIVAAVTNFLSKHEGNILYLDQHVDREAGVFFMRLEWELEKFRILGIVDPLPSSRGELEERFVAMLHAGNPVESQLVAEKVVELIVEVTFDHRIGKKSARNDGNFRAAEDGQE